MASVGQPIEIRDLRRSRQGGVSRVTATVAGRDVWFESPSVTLAASWEALTSAFLIPALHHRRSLVLEGPLDGQFRAGLDSICQPLQAWWGYASPAPIFALGQADLTPRRSALAQCFSGGVDSFYSLLRSSYQGEQLVFVHGFDIPHYDRIRFRHARRSIQTVSDQVSRSLVMVRTNLRKHPLFASTPWERTHGGALAAIGHVLSGSLGGLVIPSSYSHDNPFPNGSHWELDGLWSSGNLQVTHDEANLRRMEKVLQIAAEPLVQQHLRVCWQNFSLTGNCSRCGKCVRTMLMLLAAGELCHYRVFDCHAPLIQFLDNTTCLLEPNRISYQAILSKPLPSEIAEAIRRMLNRKVAPQKPPWQRIAHRVRNALLRVCP
jgi:hypothetical protein